MPINTTKEIRLNAVELATILAVAPEGQTAEGYAEANNLTDERLQEMCRNFVRAKMEGTYTALGTALAVAEIEGDAEKLEQAAPHVAALGKIFGLE
jgi:tellurite resistance protein